MHAVFMLYGKKECVDFLIRDMAAQKLPLRVYDKKEDGTVEEKGVVWIECQVRILPFGIYEFIFPKEHLDVVLTSLWFHNPQSPDGTYNLNKEISIFGMKFKPLDYVKKFLRIEDAPEFKTDQNLLWYNQHIGIIPIGIRHDGEILDNGHWHEAI